jgi:hypothetical protein
MLIQKVRAAILGLTLCAFTGSAVAARQPQLLLSYDVRYGGVTIMKLQAGLDLAEGSGSGYRVAVEGRTVGLLDRLKPIAFTAVSEGRVTAGALQPALYATTTRKRDKRKGVTISFSPDAAPVTRYMPPDDDEEQAPPELLEGSLDPASALLTLIRSVAQTASCSGTVGVYDGKRRYDVTFLSLPQEVLHKTSGEPYSGTARRCKLKLRPLHGFKPGKRQPLDGTLIWLGDVVQGAPPLPVRIETEISLGAVRLDLASARWADGPAAP